VKIIAEGDDKWIVEMSKDEMSNLRGYYSSYSIGDNKKTKINTEYPISDIYNHLRDVEKTKR